MKFIKILWLSAVTLMMADFAFAQTWLPTSAPSNVWSGVASSADGSQWIALYNSQNFITSTNAGATWVTNSEPVNNGSPFQSIAVSADGSKIAGVAFNSCWVSADSGATWSSNNVDASNPIFLHSVTMSADGSTMAAIQGHGIITDGMIGAIYLSTNSGVSWTPTTAPTNSWAAVVSSADGSRLVAAVGNGNTTNGNFIYISTNSGADWLLSQAPSNIPWASLASSADGSKVVVGGNFASYASMGVPGYLFGSIYTSTDSGMTWQPNNVPRAQWLGVASSADGTRLVAVGLSPLGTGLIYSSTNSGASWVSNSAPNLIWNSVASSADGVKLLAAPFFNSGTIYTLQTTPTPQLNLAASSPNLALSWIIPSANFVLQQSPDLISWTDVTNSPTLNLTSLQNQVTLPPSNSSGFFRLKTP
jgi:hypothetical protein